MRISFIVICVFISLSCADQNKPAEESISQGNSAKATTPQQSSDSITWTNSFLEFSKAVISGDKDAVKKFIDFPIKNEGNEIWFLADSKLVMEIDPDKIKPFTEADYEKYFSSIFSLDLRKTLEKIDTGQFFKTHESTSPEIEVVKDSKSALIAAYNKGAQKMTLLLNNKGQEFELSVRYEFDITPDQELKFRQVRVAG
jgi:hypothetical protein